MCEYTINTCFLHDISFIITLENEAKHKQKSYDTGNDFDLVWID